jgi:hypothetical protein
MGFSNSTLNSRSLINEKQFYYTWPKYLSFHFSEGIITGGKYHYHVHVKHTDFFPLINVSHENE